MSHLFGRTASFLAMSMLASVSAAGAADRPLRAGIIGLDTSHSVKFTEILNAAPAGSELATLKIVAAFPAGSPDIADSRDRVGTYTAQMHKLGVEIVDSVDSLIAKSDVVLVESLDGRPHLAQAGAAIRAGKKVFVDKPVAGSLSDAVALYRLAEEHNVPCFSSSALRFQKGIHSFRTDSRVGKVLGCQSHSPCELEAHHPDLFWYGIHGVETLFTIMGTGCTSAARTHTPGADVVVGVWKDGRIGTFRGIRAGHADHGATVYGARGIAQSGGFESYEPLVHEIVRFFHTGKPPVSAQETLEIYAFMEAADESKREGGRPVSLDSVLERARAKTASSR